MSEEQTSKPATDQQKDLYRSILEAHCLKTAVEVIEACRKQGFEVENHQVIDSMIRWAASELIDTLKILPISVCGILAEVISDVSNETAERLMEAMEEAQEKAANCDCEACKKRREQAN